MFYSQAQSCKMDIKICELAIKKNIFNINFEVVPVDQNLKNLKKHFFNTLTITGGQVEGGGIIMGLRNS